VKCGAVEEIPRRKSPGKKEEDVIVHGSNQLEG